MLSQPLKTEWKYLYRYLEVYGDRKHGLHKKVDGIKYKYHVADMVLLRLAWM